MLTPIIALLLATMAFIAGITFFDPWSAAFLALAGLLLPTILIGRKVMRKLEAKNKEAEGHIGAQRFDKAIATFESMRPLGLWFPRLGASMDGQIGVLRYAAQRDFDKARPYLEKAPGKLWQAKAMLAALLFKKKAYDEMEAVFEQAVKRNKKQGLLWATYAYCQFKRGEGGKATLVLQRAIKTLPADQRLPTHLAAIEKGKKPKMQVYGADWFAMHVEEHPQMQAAQQQQNRFMPPPNKMGGRMMRMRGRR